MTDIASAGFSRQQLIQQALSQVGNKKPVATAAKPAPVRVSQAPQAFEAATSVKNRATFLKSVDSPENQRSLTRFQDIMDSGQPLDANAPRGFYLNIQV